MNHSLTTTRMGIASLALLLALPGIGRAAAPAMASTSTVEIHYNASSPGDAQFGYRIVATGSPTAFEATGLPPDATLDRTTGWINGNRNNPGTYDVTVRASNADGIATATVRLAIHPAATGVIASPGTFRAGQNFTFTVRYNAPVTVTGTPQLTLAIGSLTAPDFKSAAYVSGSGTNELVFRYTVADTDVASAGVRLLPSAPAGGTISDASGLSASPSLPVRHFVSGIVIAANASDSPVGAGFGSQ